MNTHRILRIHDDTVRPAGTGTFHQQRLQLYLKILVAFFGSILAFAVLRYATVYESDTTQWLTPVRDGVLLFALLTAFLLWRWLYVRGAPRSTHSLHLIDSAGTVIACGSLALMIPFIPEGMGAVSMTFLLLLMLSIRAAIVPSTGARTLVVGLLAIIPLSATLWVRGLPIDPAIDPAAYLAGLITTIWGIIFSIATMVISRVIYRLQDRLRTLGSYRLAERLGAGGMGEVWRAEHEMLARPAAIKMVRAESLAVAADSNSVFERFAQEAQATAALTCPNTIQLFDFGHGEDGSFYYVMELLDGMDLETFIKTHGPQPAARVEKILAQMCRSLREAHQVGLIHRDIKPANVFLCRYGAEFDFVKVLDFGLVKHHSEPVDTSITHDGVVVGTPAFMAPEVILGAKAVDARADLYAVGCVGYWLLSGHLVFEADTPTALLVMHAKDEPIPPSQRTELLIPKEMEELIMDCLRKDPGERPQSARELRERLNALDLGWTEQDAENWWRLHRPS